MDLARRWRSPPDLMPWGDWATKTGLTHLLVVKWEARCDVPSLSAGCFITTGSNLTRGKEAMSSRRLSSELQYPLGCKAPHPRSGEILPSCGGSRPRRSLRGACAVWGPPAINRPTGLVCGRWGTDQGRYRAGGRPSWLLPLCDSSTFRYLSPTKANNYASKQTSRRGGDD